MGDTGASEPLLDLRAGEEAEKVWVGSKGENDLETGEEGAGNRGFGEEMELDSTIAGGKEELEAIREK